MKVAPYMSNGHRSNTPVPRVVEPQRAIRDECETPLLDGVQQRFKLLVLETKETQAAPERTERRTCPPRSSATASWTKESAASHFIVVAGFAAISAHSPWPCHMSQYQYAAPGGSENAARMPGLA